jgi:hypothetical protein
MQICLQMWPWFAMGPINKKITLFTEFTEIIYKKNKIWLE